MTKVLSTCPDKKLRVTHAKTFDLLVFYGIGANCSRPLTEPNRQICYKFIQFAQKELLSESFGINFFFYFFSDIEQKFMELVAKNIDSLAKQRFTCTEDILTEKLFFGKTKVFHYLSFFKKVSAGSSKQFFTWPLDIFEVSFGNHLLL